MSPQQRAKEFSQQYGGLFGGVTGAVALLTALGFQVFSPSDQLKKLNEEGAKVHQDLAHEIQVERARIDSLAFVVDYVKKLGAAKCAETDDGFVREVLECRVPYRASADRTRTRASSGH